MAASRVFRASNLPSPGTEEAMESIKGLLSKSRIVFKGYSTCRVTGLLFCVVTLMMITSCSRYKVVLNNNVLYTPTSQPPPSLLSDPNLQGCLNQQFAIVGRNDPDSIKLLACPASGVDSLDGIRELANLEQLELSDNNISDLSPLLELRNLRVLSVRNNRITNINTLMSLSILRFVALQGNDSISCRQLDNLEEKIGNSLNRPVSCND